MKIYTPDDPKLAAGRFGKEARFTQDTEEAPFEAIYLAHSLQKRKRTQVVDYLKELRELLVERGEIWIVTPSLEWAAREIVFEDQPSMAAQLAIYGADNDPHGCGFTLYWLRVALENAGFITRKAAQELFTVEYNGTPYKSVQNIAIAMKVEDGVSGDAATAID